MKKILITALAAILLLACNTGKTKDPATVTVPEKQTEDSKLVLNRGAKWKADSATILNVTSLQKFASGANPNGPGDYLQTAAKLDVALVKMINDCKMSGPDHEALHHWLEPLMEKTTALKKVNSIQTARTLFSEIENQLTLFPQYFE